MLRFHTVVLAGICYDNKAKNNQCCHQGRWTVRSCVHRGRRNEAFTYCLQMSPSDTLQLALLPVIAAIAAVSFIQLLSQYGSFPWSPFSTMLITHYFQMISVEIFTNSKAIWLIRAFGLGVHNWPHVPPLACRYRSTKSAPPACLSFILLLRFLSICLYVQNLYNPICRHVFYFYVFACIF